MAGLARARKQGTKRPPRIDAATEGAIRVALVKGDKGMRKIAVELGVVTGTVQRVSRRSPASLYACVVLAAPAKAVRATHSTRLCVRVFLGALDQGTDLGLRLT
jgi:hypothetical protein